MESVTSEMVAEYIPMVKHLANKYTYRWGVEFDDLVQEGLIDAWLTLRRGKAPSAKFITARMRRWCDFATSKNPCDYEDMLPLEDYEHEYHRLQDVAAGELE